MASAQRLPRTYPSKQNAEYQASGRAAPAVRCRTSENLQVALPEFEDLLEEIKLKKLKLHCKDEMERIAARIVRMRANSTQ